GLNLTWETLEGLIKHNGPLTDRAGRPIGRYEQRGLPAGIPDNAAAADLMLWSHAGPEAQVAAVADDIAYNAHDIDDGLRADPFRVGDLGAVAAVGDTLGEIRAGFPGLDTARLVHELIRRLIGRLIEDVIAESGRRLAEAAPRSADDVRFAGKPLVGFSPAMSEVDAAIKGFLFPRMYRHPRIMRIMDAAEGIVRDLFHHFVDRPGDMPAEWAQHLEGADLAARARRVADFIAGMTDRYALIEHARRFDLTPELV